MPHRELTSTIEDYLKVIWAGGEWSDEPVTIGSLARAMGLAPSSVSETIKRLTAQGLVEHEPYRGIRLTAEGECAAVAMIRRHRILETYLVHTFGYSWDEVHDEAENLEHGVSDRLINAMDAALGHPELDPHGDPIPSRDGAVPPRPDSDTLHNLATVDPDVAVAVTRVSDNAPELLRYCEKSGLVLGAKVKVVERIPAAQLVQVEVGGEVIGMSMTAAAAVWVTSESEIN